MAEKLLLLRHAETGPRFRGRFLGSTDVAASREGLERLGRLQPLLEHYSPASWYCSPSTRAKQTEKTLRRIFSANHDTCFDSLLQEIDFGDWEKQTFKEVARTQPHAVEEWLRRPLDFCFPGGESLGDFAGRMETVLHRLLSDPAEHILVITHGGVIRVIICLLLGLSPADYLLFEVEAGRMTLLDIFGTRGVLSGLNL